MAAQCEWEIDVYWGTTYLFTVKVESDSFLQLHSIIKGLVLGLKTFSTNFHVRTRSVSFPDQGFFRLTT